MNVLKNKNVFIIVLLLTLLLAYIAAFGFSHIDNSSDTFKGAADMRFGIDINGGIDAVFAPKDLDRRPTDTEMESARAIIETRLDQQSIFDRDVIVDTAGYIIVRFPWKSDETDFDPGKAIEELGSMAHLTFRDPDGAVVMEGSQVDSASAMFDQSKANPYYIQLKLKPDGQAAFAEATARLVGQVINIYMDETLISYPTVQQAIDSDTCVITNLDSFAYAKTLANQINSGALPFALYAETYSAISPTLGSNALDVMLLAGLIAFIFICLSLILYYRASGMVAAITLILQLAGQILLLTLFQFSITLPGIAGIILAIGMGVGANIIISERVRDELKAGKNVESALLSGFQRAFSSVFDSNLTVAIVAIIMMIFGTGAILSFAYTLLFGVLMNFVAGIGANRLILLSLAQFRPFQKVSRFISEGRLSKPPFKVHDFFKNKRICYLISASIIALGLVMAFVNGVNLDIEFTGGAIIQYTVTDGASINPDEAAGIAREVMSGQNITGRITENELGDRLVLSLNSAVSNEELQQIRNALMDAYPDQSIEEADNKSVNPYFSQRYLSNGIWALGLASLFIILFVWIRYRRIHGLSAGAMALLALLHDVCIVFFTFVIFRMAVGESFIAVALMILGYSLSDTIVIYDRIREYASKNKNAKPDELVNQSVSHNLTRSINTSVTVFVTMMIVYVLATLYGLDSIRAFAMPMCIGTASGCYTSVCLTSPTWALWQNFKDKRAAKRKG